MTEIGTGAAADGSASGSAGVATRGPEGAPPLDPASWYLRTAVPGDEAAILRLVRELALYEREPDAVEATEADLRTALFGPDALAGCLLAEVREPDVLVVGMALWFPTFSTWTGRRGIWLEDLYVTGSHRRRGIARALIAELAATCVEHGWGRLEWDVLDWNTDAIACYRSVGAEGLPEWVRHRVAGTGLLDLASTRLAAAPGSAATTGCPRSEQP